MDISTDSSHTKNSVNWSFWDPIKRFLVRLCWWLIQHLKVNEALPPQTGLPDLCPTDRAANTEISAQALDEYLARPCIREIAVTSPYGGGKSSFILSYFRSRSFYQVRYVTLAVFLDQVQGRSNHKQVDDSISPQDVDLKEIETSLLEQITDASVERPQIVRQGIMALAYTITGLTGLYVYHHHLSVESILLTHTWWQFPGWIQHIFASTALAVVFLLTRDAINMAGRLRKVNFFKVSAEIDIPQSDSVLSQNMAKIVQFFYDNRIDIVVIEDLDRFEREDIFLKLKEVNKHINDCKQIRRTVRFLYAIGDDVFNRYNRTKFFDAIIPIIPATNTHKSASLLKNLIKTRFDDASYTELKQIIDSVALYIVDMRLLNNIVADYEITLNSLHQTRQNIDRNKLFGFVVYRNHYPDDYAKLQNRDGVFYGLTRYDRIKRFREAILSDLISQKEKIEQDIQSAKNKYWNDVSEINIIYIIRALKREGYGFWNVNKINNKPINEYFSPNMTVMSNRLNVSLVQGKSFPIEIFDSDDDFKLYCRHHEIFKLGVREIENELEALEQIIDPIQRSSLRDLILNHSETITDILRQEKIIGVPDDDQSNREGQLSEIPDLLYVLIAQGYLDEHYMDYSYHRHPEDDLGENETNFLMAAKENHSFDIDVPLRNIHVILNKMNQEDLRSPAVLNYAFIDYVIKADESVLPSVLLAIQKHDRPIEIAYDIWFQNEERKEDIAKWFAKDWDRICSEAVYLESGTDEKHRIFLLCLMAAKVECGGANDLVSEKSDLEPILSCQNYFFPLPSYLTKKHRLKLFDAWKRMGVLFTDLSQCPIDNSAEILELCIEYEVYALNKVNIETITRYLEIELNEAGVVSYSDIKLLDNNFPRTLEDRLDKTVKLIIDGVLSISDEVDIIEIINHSEISGELKQSFIACVVFSIANVEQLDNPEDILPELINHDRIESNWENVKYINDTLSADDCVSILENHYKILCNILEKMDTQQRLEINKWLPLSSLSLVAFKAYVIALHLYQSKLADLDREKIQCLIECAHLSIRWSISMEINSRYPDLAIDFVERNNDELTEDGMLDSDKIDNKIIYSVLQSIKISRENKKHIFDSQKQYIDESFWTNLPDLDFEQIMQFFSFLDREDQLKLIMSKLHSLDDASRKRLIESYDDGIGGLFNNKKTCSFDASPERETLLKYLETHQFIHSYKLEGEDGARFKVTLKKSS